MTAVGIDIGGTFTDVVILRDDGSVGTTKTPSTPGRLQEGLFEAINAIAEKEEISLEELLASVERIAHGTTAPPQQPMPLSSGAVKMLRC